TTMVIVSTRVANDTIEAAIVVSTESEASGPPVSQRGTSSKSQARSIAMVDNDRTTPAMTHITGMTHRREPKLDIRSGASRSRCDMAYLYPPAWVATPHCTERSPGSGGRTSGHLELVHHALCEVRWAVGRRVTFEHVHARRADRDEAQEHVATRLERGERHVLLTRGGERDTAELDHALDFVLRQLEELFDGELDTVGDPEQDHLVHLGAVVAEVEAHGAGRDRVGNVLEAVVDGCHGDDLVAAVVDHVGIDVAVGLDELRLVERF